MANLPMSSCQDFFGGTALSSAWTTAGADITLDAALDRVQMTCQPYYPDLTARGLFDATGSSFFARLTPPPIGNGSVEMLMRLLRDSSNKVTFFVSGGILIARVTNAGVNTDTTIGPYNSYLHAWWRLRESGGQILFDTSPDGWSWTNRASIACTWNVTAVTLTFLCGYWSTEATGMAGYVDHVNTLTSAPDQPNLNWPTIEDSWGPLWNANGGTQPQDRYVNVTDRTRHSSSIGRGRQYELDQVRSGEADLKLANTDAALDPLNAAGPWAGHIAPFQPFRKRAQWPPTRNLMEQAIATGGDLGGYPLGTFGAIGFPPNVGSKTDATGGAFVASPMAWQGSTVMQFAVPSGTAAPTRICHTASYAPAPGTTYTVQVRVRNVTASTSLSVQPFIGWYTVAGGLEPATYAYGATSVLTGSTTAGWTVLTVTATAPWNVAGMDVGVAVAATASAACTVQADGWQTELGAVATTWQCPGVWYPMYAGWVERWSPEWEMDGTYGLVSPSLTDTFSLLSQQPLPDALNAEIAASNPRFVYRMDDPAGSTAVADFTGQYPPAPIGVSKNGAGTLTLGQEITAVHAGKAYTGSTGTVAHFVNANPGSATNSAASFIRLSAAGILGPTDGSVWTRLLAFRYTGPTPTAAAVLWSAYDRQRKNPWGTGGSSLLLQILPDGNFSMFMSGWLTNGTTYSTSGQNVADGDWHFAAASYDQSKAEVTLLLDSTLWVFSNVKTADAPYLMVIDSVGSAVDPNVPTTNLNFMGDISFIAEFPTALPGYALQNMYFAWRKACADEPTGTRYRRILRYAGYTGPANIADGMTQSMGPANIEGQDAMTALQAVVETESGAHFVDAAGVIQFQARSARYNALTPAFTFGENTSAGEWPYEDCQPDYDSTHLANQVTVQQEPTGQNFYAADDASVAAYFPRPMSRTINSQSAGECNDAASYLLSRYRRPAQRINSLKLHPSAQPGLWAVCLALELGTRIRVMRRPPGVPPITIDCFVENIQWDLDETNEAWCTIQCSPADLTPYTTVAAWHTTTAAAVSAGTTAISIASPQAKKVYGTTFDAVGNWRVVNTSTGADMGPITIASDAGNSGAKATAYTIMEDLTEIPYDPTLVYRVSVTVRTATAPTTGTPNVYLGLTGITADGKRCNVSGQNAISSQHYCAARGTAAGSTYITYTGYVSGTATPSDSGTNPSFSSPERLRPEIVRVRPMAYLLYQATDGVQYMTDFTVHIIPADGGIPLASQLAPGQQLVLGQGTPNAETVTVSAVGASSAGWTAATAVLTSATTKTHAAGDTICEPLPTGITDPATWDGVAQLDQTAFAY